MNTVGPIDAFKLLEINMKAGLVSYLTGSPGISKSATVLQLFKKYNLYPIVISLAACEPQDVQGYAYIDPISKKSKYMPFEMFPIEGDTIPEGYQGFGIVLEELAGADTATQKAAYRLLLDRMVGDTPLHKNTALIATGNLITDNALVEDMSTALQSRMCHIEMNLPLLDWIKWANENNINPKIISFLEFKPSNLSTFNPDNDHTTYACGRTWEFVHKQLKIIPNIENDPLAVPLLTGTVGAGAAREFLSYLKMFHQIPKITEIITYPTTAILPNIPGIQYVLSTTLGEHCNEDNISKLIQYISRMAIEFQVVTLRGILAQNPELITCDEILQWQESSSTQLY